MKEKIFFSTIIFFLNSLTIAQIHTEIFEGGWGQGMSSSTPTFTDLDNDELLDMIIGEEGGYLNYYEQEAVSSTNFILVTRRFNGIDVGTWSAPCFTDLDNNGLLDMVIGDNNGLLHHYEQVASGSANFTLISDRFNGIDVGGMSKPFLTDLDNDDLLDMVVGEYEGNLNHYEQDTAGSTSFSLISDNFNGIDVGDYSDPCFTDLDGDGLLDMIVGEWHNNLNHYEQDAVGSTNFSLVTESFNDINIGYSLSSYFTDIDNDGLLDLIIGEVDGYLYHYKQDPIAPATFNLISENFINVIDVGVYSTPYFTDLDNDGLLDMIIGERNGNLNHYEQDEVGSPIFTQISDNFNGINVGSWSAPCFTDLDNDGLLDMIVGEENGNLYHYEQDGVGLLTFTLISNTFNEIDVGEHSVPCFIDLDNDNLLDLIVGEYDGNLNYYEQDAAGSVIFNLISENFCGIDVGWYSTPCFMDWYNDGLLDMIVGEYHANLNYYKHTEINSTTFTLISDRFNDINVGNHSRPIFTDVNGDGYVDLLIGEAYGGICYFQTNIAIPVELVNFAASYYNGSVELKWSTATETNNLGFEIQRSGDKVKFKKIGFVQGYGTTVKNHNYKFLDNDVTFDIYYYRLKQIDADGSFKYSNIVEIKIELPLSFSLQQNYPNPFNSSTIIKFSLPKHERVKIEIYNSLGQKVKTLLDTQISANHHEIESNAEGLSSGIYVYKIQAGKFHAVKKMLYLK